MTIKYLILKFIFFIVEKTCSWKYHNVELFDKLHKSDKPIIICIWHGFFVFPMFFLKKHYIQTKVVSSTHTDSMILARVLNDYGFNLIKGSSTRGAKNVIKEMMTFLNKNNSIIAITNDGPKGPPRIAKGGAVALAKKMNAHIVFITGKSSNYRKLKTWDSFILPKLFSKNDVYINQIDWPHSNAPEELGKDISNKMNIPIFENGIIGQKAMINELIPVVMVAPRTDIPISPNAFFVFSYRFNKISASTYAIATCTTKSTEKPIQIVMQIPSIVPSAQPMLTIKPMQHMTIKQILIMAYAAIIIFIVERDNTTKATNPETAAPMKDAVYIISCVRMFTYKF